MLLSPGNSIPDHDRDDRAPVTTAMKFSSLTGRIAGDSVDVWDVHYDGLARKEAGEDIIVLSVGEEREEFTPSHIVDAAVDSLRAGRHHYTSVNGNPDLRRGVVKRHFELTGRRVDDANCAIFAGAQNALFAVAQCLLEKGDEVILSEPYYTTYPATFGASGATLVGVPVKLENGFQIDPGDLIAAITPRTRAIVLNSPNNPVGAVYTRAQYAAVVRACVERNIWLINDDVYQELLTDDERANPLSLPDAERVCISVSGLSKSHRMTGWRLGWVIGPQALMSHLYNLAICMSYGLPAFIQDAAVAALASGTATARDVRAKLDRRREILLRELDGAPGLTLFSAEGGMFVVLDISALPVSARQFARELLARHNVAILPCDGFAGAGAAGSASAAGSAGACADLLRISLCVDDARLKDACGRIVEYAKALRTLGTLGAS